MADEIADLVIARRVDRLGKIAAGDRLGEGTRPSEATADAERDPDAGTDCDQQRGCDGGKEQRPRAVVLDAGVKLGLRHELTIELDDLAKLLLHHIEQLSRLAGRQIFHLLDRAAFRGFPHFILDCLSRLPIYPQCRPFRTTLRGSNRVSFVQLGQERLTKAGDFRVAALDLFLALC